MSEIIEDKKSVRVRNRRVHMANERTFLAWMRTSMGIMALGFVVEKFALFIKQVSYVLGKSNFEKTLRGCTNNCVTGNLISLKGGADGQAREIQAGHPHR